MAPTRLVCVALLAACSRTPTPPALVDNDIKLGLALLRSPDDPIRTDPDRAHLHDIVESAVIRNHTGLVLCMAAKELRNVDVIVVGRIGPSGAATMQGLVRKLDQGEAAPPERDGNVTECVRKELGASPFAGVDKHAFNGADSALVVFRPLRLGRAP